MALETPDRLAAAVILYDVSLENAYTFRSQDGSLENLGPVDLGDREAGCVMDMIDKVSNDEGCVLVSGDTEPCAGYITPKYFATGNPAFDDLAPYRVVIVPMAKGEDPGRLYLSIFRIQTTSTPIPGEPISPP